MNDIFKRDLNGEMVSPSDSGYDDLINTIWDTMKTASALNDGYHTPDEVRQILGKIIGREVDASVTLLPPFYVDYGKHIKIGKGCFIQQCCTFFGRGGQGQCRSRKCCRLEKSPTANSCFVLFFHNAFIFSIL